MEFKPTRIYLQHSQGPQCAKDDVRRGNALRGHHHCQFPDCKVGGSRDGQDLYGPEVAEPVLRVVNRKPLTWLYTNKFCDRITR